MSSSAITPENLHTPNRSIAANLAITNPTTPSRPTPNSAKKRRPMPDLSRPTATPGHGVKMSMIFRNAATSLQSSRLPTHQPSSNTKKCRIPLSQARSVKFGNTGQDDTMVSSFPGSPQKTSQHLRGSGEPGWASSETTCKLASGGRDKSTPMPSLTKASRATIGTFTNRCLGAAAEIGASRFNETPRVSGASSSFQIEDEGKEPISSGFTTPIAPTPNSVENPDEVKYPNLKNWPSLKSCCDSSSLDSDNGDLHSTHGVPFILPFPHADSEEATRSDINTWLNGIADATNFGPSSSPKSYGIEDLLMNDVPFSRMTASTISTPTRPRVSRSKFRPDSQSSSRASSNKENISPSKTSSSPAHVPTQDVKAKTPSRFCQTNNLPALQHAKAVHSAHSLSPQRHLSLPPKRKRPRVEGIASSRVEAEISVSRKDFTICEDQLVEALVQLSPDVERHRKGRGPKKERCMSYWDEDILSPGLQCVPMIMDGNDETMGKEKQVLRESNRAVELTADLPFAKDAGSANFHFKA